MNQRINTNINRLKAISNESWKNKLEIDYDGVLLKLVDEQSYVNEFVLIGTIIRKSILDNYNIENISDLTVPLSNDLKDDIKMLVLLKGFISKLNRDITIEFLKDELTQQGFWSSVESAGQSYRLSLAILLLENLTLDKLHLCFLVSRYERFAYQDYQLFLDLEGIQDPLTQAEYREIQQRGFRNIQINEELVNSILESYERSNDTRLASECIKVLEYNNETVVFVLRESQRGGLRTFREFIVGWNANLMVFRFRENLRWLKVRAVDTVKEEVFTTIVNNIVKSRNPELPINYIKCSFSNTREQIVTMLQHLLADSIPGIELNELTLENTPFEGRPDIIVKRKSQAISLPQSLTDNERGFTLSSIVTASRVSKAKVVYITNRGRSINRHIFLLKIIESNNHYFIFLSGQGGGLNKRLRLINLINEYTGVRILELKEERN